MILNKYNITKTTRMFVNAPECFFYAETKKLKDVNTKEKLKVYLNELSNKRLSACNGLLLANSIKFKSDSNSDIKYKYDKLSLGLLDKVEDDEVIFIDMLTFEDNLFSMMINGDIPLTLETVGIGNIELIKTFIQEDKELVLDLDFCGEDKNDSYLVGVITSPKEEIKTIDLYKLYEECNDDDDLIEEQLSEKMLGFLQEKLNK